MVRASFFLPNSHTIHSVIALVFQAERVTYGHTNVWAFVTIRFGETQNRKRSPMNTRKPFVAAGVIAAISIAGVGVATASPHTSHFALKANVHAQAKLSKHFASSTIPQIGQVDPIATTLADLVKAGTITQAQSDAISAALKATLPVRPSISGVNGGGDSDGPDVENNGSAGLGIDLKADFSVITTTLGITQDQLQADFAAGQSLAVIAGDKTSALITALVAVETTNINAQVTAGDITQADATTLIAGLTASVTAAVNAVPNFNGMGHQGDNGNGGDQGDNQDNGNGGDQGDNQDNGSSVGLGAGVGVSVGAPDSEGDN